MKDDALYLEADEDITSAIDKLHKSSASAVQIVVPKRSTMLQSIINLKLLKKAAENSGKKLVLVTNDRLAGELAARVGLGVAPSLGAKAVLAEAKMPTDLKSVEEVIEADDPEPPPADPEPAAEPIAPTPPKRPVMKNTAVSDGPPEASAPESAVPNAAAAAKSGPKVPNFNRLQRRLLWVGVAVLLIVGYVAGMYFLTSAKVTLYANGTKVDIDTTFAVDPSAHQTDDADAVLAGQTVTVSKDLSGPFTPTGKQDAGAKAAGTMTIGNCYDQSPHTLVAGTRFTAPDGSIFLSTADVTVPPGQGSFFGCTTPGTATVNVQASQNGDHYNEAPASYNIPGLPASEQTGANAITAKGAQMSGGVTKTVNVVTQNDVDTEQAALLAGDKANSTRDLQGRVPSGYTAFAQSQASSVTNIAPSPAVNAVGDTGTLTIHVTYTELAVKQTEYESFIRAQETKQLGGQNQVYDDGLASAQVTASNKDSSGRQTFHFTTEAFGGEKIDTAALATQLKGKRYGDATDITSRLPGVSHADISVWPGWATSLPSRTGKIKITIQVADK